VPVALSASPGKRQLWAAPVAEPRRARLQ